MKEARSFLATIFFLPDFTSVQGKATCHFLLPTLESTGVFGDLFFLFPEFATT